MTDLQRNTAKRWIIFNKVFIMICCLIIFFAYMDSVVVRHFFEMDAAYQAKNGWDPHDNIWEIFTYQVQPVYTSLWYSALIVVAIVYYLLMRDKSEALALFLTPATWIFFGVQDIIYFVFSGQSMAGINCWADMLPPVRIISDVLGETCPTALSFTISAAIGLVLGYAIFFFLKYHSPHEGRRKR